MDLRVSDVVEGWGLRRLGGLPAGLAGDPGRRPGDDPRRPRRAGRLPRRGAGARCCRWSGSLVALGPAHRRRSTPSSTARGGPLPAIPGATSSTPTARRSRRGTSPTPCSCGAWPAGRPWSTDCPLRVQRAFWWLAVVGPVLTGAGDGLAGLPLGHRRRGGRRRGHAAAGRGSRTGRTRSVTLGTCPSRPADRVAASGTAATRAVPLGVRSPPRCRAARGAGARPPRSPPRRPVPLLDHRSARCPSSPGSSTSATRMLA